MTKNTAIVILLLGFLIGEVLAEDYLIPLDDRPANLLFVRQLSRVGAPQNPLRTPPEHLLGKLYSPGQSDKIIDWADSRLRAGDTLFVSIDMWLYGGLVASRTADIDADTVLERLARLQDIGARGVTVHALATLPRLSLRTSDSQAPYELKLSKWAAKSDLPSVTELLSQRSEGELGQFPTGVPIEAVLEYLGVRTRNVETILRLVALTDEGFVDTLVIGQDDSNKTGLHKFEQKDINSKIASLGVGKKVTLLSGIDELTMTMVAGIWAKRSGVKPTIRVIYNEPSAAKKVPPLESIPLETMIAQHVELAGASVVQNETADIDLYVYVPYSKPWKVPGEERRPTSESFVRGVAEAQQSGREIAVADLSLVNRMDPFLAESSLELLSLHDLEGFASWNTPANTVGTVLAQVVEHQIAERSPHWSLFTRLESEKTHQAFLLARFIDDYAYQTVVRDDIKGSTKGLSANADPLLNLFGPVGVAIRVRLVHWAEEIFSKYYLGRSFCLEPQGVEVEFRRSKLEVVLPWPRIFEVEARLDIRLRPIAESCDDM